MATKKSNNLKNTEVNTTTSYSEIKTIEQTEIEKETTKEIKKKIFKPTDLIECKSITAGTLVMIGSKSNIVYEWAEYGDTQFVEYQDLIYVIRSNSKFIFTPLFIINDDDVLEQNPNVVELYENIYNTNDLIEVFNLPDHEMVDVIEAMPDGVKDTLKSLASRCISDGRLDSLNKINLLDSIFGTSLILVSNMN